MIVATAGHVDHGKTSLVRALTGVDTDRLEEERRRGMSIDLGFAYADLGGGQPVGFVDVPGHERFLRNMLAGVAAIDVALLVVAADDGPMPQTREHLAILGLLGVGRGAVALTKIDRVSPERHAAVQAEIQSLLADGPLAGIPVFPVATPTGEGLEALRAYLAMQQQALAEPAARGNFRLAIDRGFTLSGAGLVVTGAAYSGSARVGDRLLLSPRGTEVRVRAIHAQGQPAEIARAGQRCALNLAGADLRKAEVGRGDWLVAPRAHLPGQRFDVRLVLLPGLPRGLWHWAPVQVHHGSGTVSAHLALLDTRTLAPGAEALAQLVTDAPVCALRGDRFILRDPAARLTLGGGVVLDPFGPQRGRASPARLSVLEAMSARQADQALAGLLAQAPQGLRLDRFEQAWNLDEDTARQLPEQLGALRFTAEGQAWVIDPQAWQALRTQLLEALEAHHAQHPARMGPTESELARALGQHRPTPALRALMRALLEEGALRREGPSLLRPGHEPRLADAQAALLAQVRPVLQAAGLRPPIVGELAVLLGLERAALLEQLEEVARTGHLVRVAPNRFYLPATVDALAHAAAELAAAAPDGSFDAAAYRDHTGIGRNLTIEVLEYLDRIGVTRFARMRRWLVDPAAGQAPPAAGAPASGAPQA